MQARRGRRVCSNGEEWYRLRSGVQRLMLDLQSVGTFLPLVEPVADDFVQRIDKTRDPATGIVHSLHNEIAKWNLECKFGGVTRQTQSKLNISN